MVRAENELLNEIPDRFKSNHWTLEKAESILALAKSGVQLYPDIVRMATTVIQSASITGLEHYRWDTVGFNLEKQKWEILEKGDWKDYDYKYRKEPNLDKMKRVYDA